MLMLVRHRWVQCGAAAHDHVLPGLGQAVQPRGRSVAATVTAATPCIDDEEDSTTNRRVRESKEI